LGAFKQTTDLFHRFCYREKAVKAGTLQTARSDEKAAAVNQAGGFFENGKLGANQQKALKFHGVLANLLSIKP